MKGTVMSVTATDTRITDTATGRPVPGAYHIVICTGCETEQHTRPGQLPNEWEVETIGDSTYAFCPDCAIDLPRQETAQ